MSVEWECIRCEEPCTGPYVYWCPKCTERNSRDAAQWVKDVEARRPSVDSDTAEDSVSGC